MDVAHVSQLANLTLTPVQNEKFTTQFADILSTISVINELDTSKTQPTSQVTGLVNVTREDRIDSNRILTQSAAITQASASYKGYIVVPAILYDQAK